ncbi:MAG TPA: phosphoribosylaminoimidazolesuccinocarboxamide synthase [Phycisphaerales bacterium]|nr:phosphoribosylaminoimidazolesuccinocarboxamide synthase [Phycisphaerales bacterium]
MTSTAATPASSAPVYRATLRLPGARSGKVRDTFVLPAQATRPAGHPASRARMLMVASDRVSAFDVVMPTPIPGKGRLLTQIAAFWFRWIEARGLCRTHLLSSDAAEIPASAFGEGSTPRELLEGRVTIGRLCRVVPIECVVRGYVEGSGWKDYQATGAICGVRLRAGLRQCDRLPEPIFTPATKAEEGHDENITFDQAAEAAGAELMAWLREKSLAIYHAAAAYALERGIIIADTKFEFGLPLGQDGKPTGEDPILIDEALTPDSSRFWPADRYEPGHSQTSFDKQFLREYLETLVKSGKWNKTPPGPELPAEVVEGTISRYREAASRLTA